MTTSYQDVVGVFDSKFAQLFVDARPMKASISETSKIFEHPLETGAVIADHRIINPVDIVLPLVVNALDYASVFQQVKSAFVNASILTVQTKVGSYENMVIQEMPHEETPEMFDTVSIALKLRQARFVTAQYGKLPPAKVAAPKHTDTVKQGKKSAKDDAGGKKKGSVLAGLFH